MELTETDPVLALLGQIIGRTGILPTDPRLLALVRKPWLLQYTYYWLQKRDIDVMDQVSRMLGTKWSYDDIHPKQGEMTAADPSKIFIPLLAGIQPDIIDMLKKVLRPPADGDTIDMSTMDRKDFMLFAENALDLLKKARSGKDPSNNGDDT